MVSLPRTENLQKVPTFLIKKCYQYFILDERVCVLIGVGICNTSVGLKMADVLMVANSNSFGKIVPVTIFNDFLLNSV